MQHKLSAKIIEVCDKKLATKGLSVSLSLYAFFAKKNDNPARLRKQLLDGLKLISEITLKKRKTLKIWLQVNFN